MAQASGLRARARTVGAKARANAALIRSGYEKGMQSSVTSTLVATGAGTITLAITQSLLKRGYLAVRVGPIRLPWALASGVLMMLLAWRSWKRPTAKTYIAVGVPLIVGGVQDIAKNGLMVQDAKPAEKK